MIFKPPRAPTYWPAANYHRPSSVGTGVGLAILSVITTSDPLPNRPLKTMSTKFNMDVIVIIAIGTRKRQASSYKPDLCSVLSEAAY